MSIASRHVLALTVVALGCGEGTAPLAGGAVRARVVGQAGLSDADTGRVILDGRQSRVVSGAGEVLFVPVSAGEHLVTLDQLRSGCAVSGEPSRTVEVAPGDTTEVEFEVGCVPAAGAMVVRIAVSGEDRDPSGYTVEVDGRAAASGVFGSAALTVASGRRAVTLRDLTRSCRIEGDSARAVDVPPGGAVSVEFAVACSLSPPAGRAQEIVFQTGRAGLNPLGDRIVQLYAVNTDGTGLHLLSADPRGQQTNPAWSPDGSRLLFSVQTEALRRHIFGMRADGSGVEPFLAIEGEPAWSPDMTRVAFSTFQAPLEEDWAIALVPVDAPDPENLDLVTTASGLSRPSWSPDGSRLAYVSIDEGGFVEMKVVDLATRISEALPIGLTVMGAPQWSPDGARLLFSGSSGRFGDPQDIYVAGADGLELIRLTNTSADEVEPAWSPDGNRIVFAGDRDGNYEIYVMNADGSHPVRLTNDPAEDRRPAWRP